MGNRNYKLLNFIKNRIKKSSNSQIENSPSSAIHIALLGTGGPMNNSKRIGATGIGIISDDKFMLFDCGSGVWRNADLMKLPRANLKAIFLTHFHSDHIADLGETAFGSWVQGRTIPLEIYGPEGVQDIVDGYSKAYSHDFRYRILHHGEEIMPIEASQLIPKPISLPLKGTPELPSESVRVYTDETFNIHAWEADHGPVKPAVSYRIYIHGKHIVILGDTNYHPWMHKLCKNADLIISNAILHEAAGLLSVANANLGFFRFAKITTDIQNYHMSPIQAATLTHEAGAKKLVLVHVTPPILNWMIKRKYLKGVKKIFSGPVVLGEDKMLMTIK
ncbi:MAG: MBL fold metallo-hydrolase [Candidatus Lokiarchaeota archaeon]|nr:MBL fold metallo-hydrolase [Candidatus Lokiarchaeota archaeon]